MVACVYAPAQNYFTIGNFTVTKKALKEFEKENIIVLLRTQK